MEGGECEQIKREGEERGIKGFGAQRTDGV